MRRAILLVVLSLFVISIPVFAEEAAEQKGIDIEKKKEDVVSRIDKRIGILQDLKKCITDAATKEELKKCRESFKEEKSGIWREMKRKTKE
ncbi:MAG: hypothetical protein HY786_08440 [Deltaproteobacteria bacterium]|nr:hypothetical protein [Deltaproteobacteria bacterium]